ncbi:MAG: cellulase family glycosylhydrolase [Lentisphaeria bacterium]|nr:cellulase family glycosylhydrolase [Lentisphaeria bacterium]
MTIYGKFLLRLTLLLFAVAVSAGPLKPQWKLCRGAGLETRDGKQYLRVTVRPEDKAEMNCASAEFDLTPYAGCMAEFSIRARAKEVSEPRNYYNGVKFMLNFTDADGREYWNNVLSLSGTFDWRTISFCATVGVPGGKSQLKLGLQESSGEVEFDLDSLRVTKLFSTPDETYTADYSDAVRSTPQLRGVMSPVRFREEDFATLREWNVNLVRAQMIRNWHKANAERDLGDYDRWLDGMLDHYEEMFKLGHEKYGLRFVIDLHTLPGGRYENREMAMFHEKLFADHFIAVWKKIATRFRDNPAVWGYDLVNEPVQIRRAPYDYWSLQRQAAEAVRAIDPERPIFLESNMSDAPETFRYLAPLRLKNIIYQVHMYKPGAYTHQRVKVRDGRLRPGEKPIAYPGVIGGTRYDREELRRDLQPVRDFQQKYGARIYVGEFSAAVWAPGAAEYLRDLIAIFEEYGWDWTYHAFRESAVWDVEKAGTDRTDIRPAADTDRKRVLLEAFKRNKTE